MRVPTDWEGTRETLRTLQVANIVLTRGRREVLFLCFSRHFARGSRPKLCSDYQIRIPGLGTLTADGLQHVAKSVLSPVPAMMHHKI